MEAHECSPSFKTPSIEYTVLGLWFTRLVSIVTCKMHSLHQPVSSRASSRIWCIEIATGVRSVFSGFPSWELPCSVLCKWSRFECRLEHAVTMSQRNYCWVPGSMLIVFATFVLLNPCLADSKTYAFIAWNKPRVWFSRWSIFDLKSVIVWLINCVPFKLPGWVVAVCTLLSSHSKLGRGFTLKWRKFVWFYDRFRWINCIKNNFYNNQICSVSAVAYHVTQLRVWPSDCFLQREWLDALWKETEKFQKSF